MKLFNGSFIDPECGCVHVTSKRIEELEARELGYIQSLRELEKKVVAVQAVLDGDDYVYEWVSKRKIAAALEKNDG